MQDNNGTSKALLGLGGNIGDPVAAMSSALQMLEQHPDCRVTRVSRLYKTPPWGKTDQEWFFNAAAEVETTLPPVALLGLALGIEHVNRRVRAERWGPRTLDIDILDFGGLVIRSEQLTIPHPRMTERGFVLMPLADFAPDFIVQGKTVRDWLGEVDRSGIQVADENRSWWKLKK